MAVNCFPYGSDFGGKVCEGEHDANRDSNNLQYAYASPATKSSAGGHSQHRTTVESATCEH